MQKHLFSNFLIIVLLFSTCKGKNAKPLQTVDQPEEPQTFFPVTDFLLGQLRELDSIPITPLKIIIEDGKRDSVWMSKKEMRKFAAPFLNPVIDSSKMNNIFSEKSFMDQTINAVTLTYDPRNGIPDSIKLNHFDVYIDPQQNKVERIYLVKEEIKNEETITTQLTWEVGKWCSIRTISQEPKMLPKVHEEIMKWNFDD
jgi:hypothetical protein